VTHKNILHGCEAMVEDLRALEPKIIKLKF